MYHAGEIKAQTLAGVQETANKIRRIVRPEIPPIAKDFLFVQNMIIVGTKDANEHMWVTALGGKAGFCARDRSTNHFGKHVACCYGSYL